MTRRLVAAALLAGTVGFVAAPAMASHEEVRVCIGGDDRNNPGRMIGLCIDNPLDIVPQS